MSREGSLEAPTRHPLDWKSEDFWNTDSLNHELERVFDLCHGCRRCVSLCQSFPVLFDLVDNSPTMEVDGVDKADYMKVVDQCYLCDLCYQTKCPYIPPHEWNIDFPHLMLRAKAIKHKNGETSASAKLISNTRTVGKLASIPVVVEAVNWGNKQPIVRSVIEKTLDVHRDAQLPEYHSKTATKLLRHLQADGPAVAAGPTTGKVAIFVTCYGDYNHPKMVEDLVAVLQHNGVQVKILKKESCCGMPKLELGDLDTVEKYKDANLPILIEAVNEGFDLIAPIPSCVLMFKQELPLMFPGDEKLQAVKRAFFDPFEYLMHRHAAGLFKTDFKSELGKIAWQVACHQRVQNIGPKTRDVLNLVPNTEVITIERCSGHDGTYGVKKDTYAFARKIAKPVETRVKQADPQHFTSDCVMAGAHIAHGLGDGKEAEHPISLIRKAYGI
ncbi:MAG TPA: heterodisulfide reductase-related iron-sulfur binding cluster [Arenimonas sp.]|jgi:Fe-S oxidoreductase|nr:heterodisulfide reductase-related iron-sulfur binding cluster [Arenimonas sp.]HOZ03921.1 heterodisulfide reductase-related iron-sulfur binding cluster [Arenimonas sp.]HPO23575.1 heterodisulfide reductase-related iron-sulfur binding cluster [Arenimonas sp.]HPW33523.1 heterodisulfide reductase-related iron-sulfur binding cluster [Arenimonas sp.]